MLQLTLDGKAITGSDAISQTLNRAGFGWVLQAETENAVLALRDNELHWLSGKWCSGTWVNGHFGS